MSSFFEKKKRTIQQSVSVYIGRTAIPQKQPTVYLSLRQDSNRSLRAFGVLPMVSLVILPLIPLAVIGCHWYYWQSENSE